MYAFEILLICHIQNITILQQIAWQIVLVTTLRCKLFQICLTKYIIFTEQIFSNQFCRAQFSLDRMHILIIFLSNKIVSSDNINSFVIFLYSFFNSNSISQHFFHNIVWKFCYTMNLCSSIFKCFSKCFEICFTVVYVF